MPLSFTINYTRTLTNHKKALTSYLLKSSSYIPTSNQNSQNGQSENHCSPGNLDYPHVRSSGMMQATQKEETPQGPRKPELQGLTRTLPLHAPLTEANLDGLNTHERAFLTHEHRLLRIDRYCQDQVPELGMQFSELKTHLSTYDSSAGFTVTTTRTPSKPIRRWKSTAPLSLCTISSRVHQAPLQASSNF